MERWTIRRVLEWTAKDFAGRGIDSARLDAELLIAEALGIDRVRLYMDLARPLTDEERDAIRELVTRRRRREPVAYILGRREFFGRTFRVSPAVLVPRPDTEILVERALERLPADAPARALDLCTGSGAVAVTLAAEREQLEVDATDVSAEALEVARDNAERLGVAERVRFLEGDLYQPVADRRYDLVVANPPYIVDEVLRGLEPEVSEHEPRLALAGGPDGLAVIGRLVEGARAHLEPGGVLLLEIGHDQGPAVRSLLQPLFRQVRIHRDLSDHDRVAEAGDTLPPQKPAGSETISTESSEG